MARWSFDLVEADDLQIDRIDVGGRNLRVVTGGSITSPAKGSIIANDVVLRSIGPINGAFDTAISRLRWTRPGPHI